MEKMERSEQASFIHVKTELQPELRIESTRGTSFYNPRYNYFFLIVHIKSLKTNIIELNKYIYEIFKQHI